MILEDAQQAVAATKRMLAAVRAGDVASVELRDALEQTRVFMAAGTAFQTAAAELIAAREQHGDGGAELLAVSAGLSQGEAHNQVKTAQALRKVPKLCDAVQTGEVPSANARRLADAITKTGAAAVAGDALLLQQAGSMRPEQFKNAAQRWITTQQANNGASEYARQRNKRYLRFYDADDGMIAIHGEFDKITGTRISNRIRHLANKLFDNDQRLPKAQRRKFPQCMADALEHTTTNTRGASASSRGARNGHDTATPSSRVSDGLDAGTDCCEDAAPDTAATNNDSNTANDDAQTTDAAFDGDEATANNHANTYDDGVQSSSAGGGWMADITLVAHVDDATGELITELSDGSQLPTAVLEELSCNTRWTGLVYDRCGDAIWRSRSRRTVTNSQWQTLLTDHGGCFHCGAPPAICQAHHIIPYSQGGETSVNNMVMVCWNCHHKIHHHNWHIQTHTNGHHTLHPPNNNPAPQPQYGPAHTTNQHPKPAPDPPPHHKRSPTQTKTNRTSPTRTKARDPAATTLW